MNAIQEAIIKINTEMQAKPDDPQEVIPLGNCS